MKGFKFKLNKVLDIKNIELRRQQKSLSEAVDKKLKAVVELQEKQNQTINYANKLTANQSSKAGDLSRQYHYYHRLLTELDTQRQLVNELEIKEEDSREELKKIKKEQKILEKLKEKEYQKFRADSFKQVQNSIDEIAGLNAQRQL